MLFNKHNQSLHKDGCEARFEQTHFGMAHLAGTGPKGKTCRECSHYRVNMKSGNYKVSGELKNGRCTLGLPGQSSRTFPHVAQSCRFFEQEANPLPAFEKQ